MPVFEVDLRKYITPTTVAEIIKSLPPLNTPVVDKVYPPDNRKPHVFPVIGVAEISRNIQNVPVVRRGTAAVPVSGGTQNISYIEPQPIEVSDFVGGADLNNLKLLDERGIQEWIKGKIDALRKIARKTVEALSAQSLKGNISYAMKVDAGIDTYTVDFGATLSYAPATLWSDTNKKIGDILKDLVKMRSLIEENSGYGGSVGILAGESAFAQLVNRVVSLGNDNRVSATITENGVNLAGFRIELMNSSYRDLINDQNVKVVDDNSIVMFAEDAPFTLYYLAIDDVDAGLQPLPLFARAIKEDNPSGYTIVAKSKPLPVPVPKAICWAQVL